MADYQKMYYDLFYRYSKPYTKEENTYSTKIARQIARELMMYESQLFIQGEPLHGLY